LPHVRVLGAGRHIKRACRWARLCRGSRRFSPACAFVRPGSRAGASLALRPRCHQVLRPFPSRSGGLAIEATGCHRVFLMPPCTVVMAVRYRGVDDRRALINHRATYARFPIRPWASVVAQPREICVGGARAELLTRHSAFPANLTAAVAGLSVRPVARSGEPETCSSLFFESSSSRSSPPFVLSMISAQRSSRLPTRGKPFLTPAS